MILPWWSKYAALLALILVTNLYTGLKVANHYQDKLAAINAIGAVQKQRVEVIEGKQKEVVKYVTRQTVDFTRASDDYWLRHPSTGNLPNAAALAGRTGETPASGTPDTARCTEADGAADAILVIQLQAFYNGLREAQK